MKKLFLTLSIITLIFSLNLNASKDDLTKKAIKYANKTGKINTKDWIAYVSKPYNVGQDSEINYPAFESFYNTVRKVSVSVWIKNDNTQSALYIFCQTEEKEYIDTLMLSSSLNIDEILTSTYINNFDSSEASLKAKISDLELKNVNISMGGTKKGKFITNGIFQKIK